VRGATTVETNTAEAIVAATGELLRTMIEANAIEQERVASVLFTTTMDLTPPSRRSPRASSGWTDIALLNAHEMAVPGALHALHPDPLAPEHRAHRQANPAYLSARGHEVRPDLAMQAGGWSETWIVEK
jgi:chorismate mutase